VHPKEVVELRADGDDGIQRIERALQDDCDLGPTNRPKFVVICREEIDCAGGPVAADRLGVEEHLAGGDDGRGAKQPDRGQCQCGFAAAALAGEAEHATPPEHEVAVDDRMDRFVAIAVVDAEAANLEDRIRRV